MIVVQHLIMPQISRIRVLKELRIVMCGVKQFGVTLCGVVWCGVILKGITRVMSFEVFFAFIRICFNSVFTRRP